MRIVSFSLYGTNPIYTKGAIANARLMSSIYPGWTMFVYHGAEVPKDIISTLNSTGCETILMPHVFGTAPAPLVGTVSPYGKFWRFMAVADPRAEFVIFRDCDSRINVREACAVKAWIQSGNTLHTMKDHANHDKFPILAGMWGIKGGAVDMPALLQSWSYSGDWFDDQLFLQYLVWPLVNSSAIQHGGGPWHLDRIPFPQHPPFTGFVGQRVTQDGKLLYE